MIHRIKQGALFCCLILMGLLTSCTDYNFVETGRAKAYHDTSMLTYFKGDNYNYSYLVYLINRAGLNEVFEGKSTYGSHITFIAPTNHAAILCSLTSSPMRISNSKTLLVVKSPPVVKPSVREVNSTPWLLAPSCGCTPLLPLMVA